MKAPGASFDFRAALAAEVTGAARELARAADDASALHRCRVHLKRARALVQLGAAAAPGLSAMFVESARMSMRLLAPARGLDALGQLARVLAKREPKRTAAILSALAQSMAEERARAAAVEFERVEANLRDLAALAQVWPEVSARQLSRGARQLTRRARRARRRACGQSAQNLRHIWRKREKDRLYAAELMGRAWPYRRRRKASEALTALLGQERDLKLLKQKLSATPLLEGDAAPAQRALKRRRRKARRRADALGQKLRLKRG